uniref:Uncharacterized protein n=1 Tax=Ditylenchus dipsaci TaxID=166011 RepID=A0A915D1D9_9BILA
MTWNKGEIVLNSSLPSTEKDECRAGLVQEQISCLNVLNFHASLYSPPTLSPSSTRLIVQEEEECRQCVRIMTNPTATIKKPVQVSPEKKTIPLWKPAPNKDPPPTVVTKAPEVVTPTPAPTTPKPTEVPTTTAPVTTTTTTTATPLPITPPTVAQAVIVPGATPFPLASSNTFALYSGWTSPTTSPNCASRDNCCSAGPQRPQQQIVPFAAAAGGLVKCNKLPDRKALWFREDFDLTYCPKDGESISAAFKKKFPRNLLRNGKEIITCELLSTRIKECQKKQQNDHWNKRKGRVQSWTSSGANFLPECAQLFMPVCTAAYTFRLVPTDLCPGASSDNLQCACVLKPGTTDCLQYDKHEKCHLGDCKVCEKKLRQKLSHLGRVFRRQAKRRQTSLVPAIVGTRFNLSCVLKGASADANAYLACVQMLGLATIAS